MNFMYVSAHLGDDRMEVIRDIVLPSVRAGNNLQPRLVHRKIIYLEHKQAFI